MPRDVSYHVPPEQIETWQKAYDSGRMALDIAEKLRAGGNPQPQLEAQVRAGIEKVKRMAASFDVELEE